ncbi:MASE3 domain-containing protein [Methanosarcina sp.]|uniref:MASE3 domain-containing protein n=1 Tax=Methanosarcina sp. TaxID=2213 RepID=UPI003BB6B2C2
MKIAETEKEISFIDINNIIIWIVVTILLYIISLKSFLLFHTLAGLFSALVAYIVFLIIWESKSLLLNRYLLLIGSSFFFIGSFDLLHILAFRGIGILPIIDLKMTNQFWIFARYIESISFMIAPLFLVQNNTEKNDLMFFENSRFVRNVFLIYAIVAACIFILVFYLTKFPLSNIEDLGLTLFKQISEYLISLIFCFSLILLYTKRERFDKKVFILISVSIVLAICGELPFIGYNHMDKFPSFVGHMLKMLSLYLTYKAIVVTGFGQPNSILFRELKQREEALNEEATFQKSEKTLIYTLFGAEKDDLKKETAPKNSPKIEEDYHSFMQNFSGILFQLDRDLSLIFMEGAVQKITGYSKEDFLFGNLKWDEIVVPEDLSIYYEKRSNAVSSPELSVEFEYRIEKKEGGVRWLREIIRQNPKMAGKRAKFQGSVHDITERKYIMESLEKYDKTRIKEIHHRIKNNLQIITSLLDLQAEKFSKREAVQTQEILNAFKDSQNRVISMALIHQELYKSRDMATLDFASYLQKLTADLLNSYIVEGQNVSLKLNLEPIYLDMDTAIPLGIIVNELISNSLKHAFQPERRGEIRISLCRSENSKRSREKFADPEENIGFKSEKRLLYTLVVADNGAGLPEVDIENTDSLGLQLINLLVDQIDGHLELKRDEGTEFIISFNNTHDSKN